MMPGKTYNPDHTAHIRRLIKQMLVRGIFGLLMTALIAAAATIIGSMAHVPSSGWLVTTSSILLFVLAAASVLTVLTAGVFWLIYLVRRRNLDARGAEAIGEFNARRANNRRGHTDRP